MVKKMSSRILSIDFTISPADINDIICAAIEGGITYWCSKYVISNEEWPPGIKSDYAWEGIGHNDNHELTFYPNDWKRVSTGITMNRSRFLDGFQKWLRDKESVWPINLDTGDIDAGDADNIIQYALFGELRYS